MISYDPNYRPFLWDSAERAREALLAALSLADIVKVSEEEMELLTGEVQLAAGADALASRGAALVLVTLGPRGAYYRAAAGRGLLPAKWTRWTLRARATLFWERCCRALRARRWKSCGYCRRHSGSALSRLQTQRAA